MKRFKLSVFLTTSLFSMLVNFNLLAQGTTAPTAAAAKPSTFFLGKWDVLSYGFTTGRYTHAYRV